MKINKLCIYFLIVLAGFIIPKVYAFDMQDLTSPYDGTFGNNNNSTYVITSMSTYSDGYEWHTTNAITTSPSGGGASFCFSPPSILVKDHTYSITIAMTSTQSGVTKPLTIVSLNNYTFVRAGYSIADAMTRTTGASIKYFGATTETIGSDTFYFMHYLIGATNGNYQSVCLPFTTTNAQSNMLFGFYGLLFDDLGYSSQLSQSDLTNVVNNINNEIHSYSQSIINNNNTNTQSIIDNANQNQAQSHQDAINTQNTIKDDSVDNPNTSITTIKNSLASNGVITSLVVLPVTLYQAVLNSVNGSCATFSLGSLFGTNLTIPCINVSNYLGTTLWGSIDVIISGIFIYMISRKMVKVFNQLSSLKEGDVLDG